VPNVSLGEFGLLFALTLLVYRMSCVSARSARPILLRSPFVALIHRLVGSRDAARTNSGALTVWSAFRLCCGSMWASRHHGFVIDRYERAGC